MTQPIFEDMRKDEEPLEISRGEEILHHSPHVNLVGDAALRFPKSIETVLTTVPPKSMGWTPRGFERHKG